MIGTRSHLTIPLVKRSVVKDVRQILSKTTGGLEIARASSKTDSPENRSPLAGDD